MIQNGTQNKVTITDTKGKVVYSSSSKKEDMGVMLNIALEKATLFFEQNKTMYTVDAYVDGLRTATHRVDSDR